MRPFSVISFVLLLGATRLATADVVILVGNDMPLTGRIVGETETAVKFTIQGLADEAHILIQKDRIRRYWREENTYWDYVTAEKERKKTLARLSEDLSGSNELTFEEPAPEPVRSRSGDEIRQDLVRRAFDRMDAVVPNHPALRIAAMLLLFFSTSVLLYVGGRISELPRMNFGRATLLALFGCFLVAYTLYLFGGQTPPTAVPLMLVGEAAAFVLCAWGLGGGAVSRAVLLLSFFLASVALAGATLFSLLSL